jgi:hypothetical protein
MVVNSMVAWTYPALVLVTAGVILAAFMKRRRMNRALPIVVFDTGAHNRLAKDPGDKERIFTGIRSRYFFRLGGLSYEELVSTPNSPQRLAFLVLLCYKVGTTLKELRYFCAGMVIPCLHECQDRNFRRPAATADELS